ncbi:MAG TPA: hypothetical protein VEW07_09130, partial [Solirubrobacterales bacterium]|nr:hypothetical protein [Solirubrobacterales bacterium]
MGAVVLALFLSPAASASWASPPKWTISTTIELTRGEPSWRPAGRADRDGDGLPDRSERRVTRTDPRLADTDRDGLSDWTEVKRTRTNPRAADTDRDGYSDGVEVQASSNPRSAASVPTAPPSSPPQPPAPQPPA